METKDYVDNLGQERLNRLFVEILKMLVIEHPFPWKVASDRGIYIEDAKGCEVLKQGLVEGDALAFIELGEKYADEMDKFSEDFEKEQELEKYHLGRLLPKNQKPTTAV